MKTTTKTPKVKLVKLDTTATEPKTTEKPKLVKLKTKSLSKKEIVDKVTPVNKNNLIETVISNRAVKYIYPDDVVDTLSRKSWRQSVRNKLDKLKMTMLEISDQNSKEYKKAKAAYDSYNKEVTKVG